MKRYFLYGYCILILLISLFFYYRYEENTKQKQLILDSNMLHHYDMAKELLHSKLRNIYFKYFDDFIIKKTLYNISNGHNEAIPLLTTLYYKNYNIHKKLLKNIVFYDKKGNLLSFAVNKNEKNLNLKLYKNSIDSEQFFLEYFDEKEKNVIKLQSISFQGSVVGYVKLVVDLDIFEKEFLYNYWFFVSADPNELFRYENSLVALQAINEENIFFILEPIKIDQELRSLKQNLFLNIFFSALVIALIIYLIYLSIKKEHHLRDEIRLQKEFFKKIINTSPNPIYVKDEKGRYLLINNAMSKLFDIEDSTKILYKKNEELQSKIEEKVFEILRQEEKKSFELKELVLKEVQKIGDQFYKFVHVPIFDFSYPINDKMVIGYATNITSEIEKKNELARLNTQLKIDINDEMANRFKIDEKFKKIFNNIHNAMFVCKVNKSGKLSEFIDINASGKIFLNRFKQFEQKTPNEIFDGFKFKYNKELDRFEVKKYSYILKIPHWEENITFQVSCNIIFINKDFHAIIFVQLIDDILKLKREKKEKQILLETIFKKAKSGIAVIDIYGEIQRFNKSFYETIGVHKNYFQRHSFFSIFDPHHLEEVKKEHSKLFEEDDELSKEYEFHINGHRIYTIASSTIIEDSNGEKLRLFIFEDITKQKQLEVEQYQNSRIIAQQAKMAEMGEMIGAIAHQWRQPLNAINAAAIRLNFAAALDMMDSKEIQEKTNFIEKQSLKMSETINDFMYFFTPSKEKQTFYLTRIYQKIFDFLEPQLKNREIEMSLDAPEDIVIFGFQNEFEHILLNLINNAKDAFDDVSEQQKKFIKIIAQEQKDFHIVKVVDNAGGIPNNILNKIFNPYFTTKDEGKGTGIGLYMTKTIIEKHFYGSIEIKNNEDGAMFTLKFPKENDAKD